MKVAVFGLGYVGNVTAAVLASNGHEVWGVDVDTGKAQAINDGRAPSSSPDSRAWSRPPWPTRRLRATTDVYGAIDGAELSLVCVGTPSSAQGSTTSTTSAGP